MDLGTLFTYQPELIELGVRHVLADPKIGSLIISLAMPGPEASVNWLGHYLRGSADSQKPAIFVMQNEDVPLAPEFVEQARRHGAIVMRSPERAVRALARFTRFGRGQPAVSPTSFGTESCLPQFTLGQGPLAEWRGKEVLSQLGVKVPDGALATGINEALVIANRVGYPVVLKAQAATLAHKSEVGGVLLNIKDDSELRSAWSRIQDNVHAALPELALDGILVETMSDRGLELVVGASRDSQWGPIIMVGLGGVWVEALGDVKLLPPGLPASAVVERLQTLKASKLLNGFRGSHPVDLQEVARVVSIVGQMMQERPEILEIDINPLVVYGEGQGATALDALLICEDPASTPTQEVSP
ncbi:hypothetical protein PkP19E3_31360 (plasmid) [Pseudomonas koreensis]|nr:hypothetical protein PkP19E3_29365 [Pseudomonas koreensis]AVX92675.1 hypothetical protein PkP19E3_31360 [Pseudomonas koreensis]